MNAINLYVYSNKMMKTKTKVIALFTAATMVFSTLSVDFSVFASENSADESSYVIVTNNSDVTLDRINEERVIDVTESEADSMPDVIVASLTQSLADRIEDKQEIISVEEDVLLDGCIDDSE